MSYTDTFILVSEDCPVEYGTVPVPTRAGTPAHLIQYELLTENPYTYNHEDLIYEVHVRHKNIPEDVRESSGETIRRELFAKSHPCLRASMLPKRYGWGVHYDSEGKIAIYGMESPEYQAFVSGERGGTKLLRAMRSKRKSSGPEMRE